MKYKILNFKPQKFLFNPKRKNHLFFCGLLFLLCLGIIYPFFHSGNILTSTDWLFHASRAQEIYDNLRDGHFFTLIATHTFSHTGAGSFLFYPSLFLYPWAGLKFIFSPITTFYLWLLGIFLAQSLVAYFCMNDFSRNRLQSFIFAVFYLVAPLNLAFGLETFTLGEFIATTFLPLVFLGAYNLLWGNPKKFYPLVFGLVGLAYSHLLSVFISGQILLTLGLIKLILGQMKKNRWISLGKSFIATSLLCLPVIIPFFSDFFDQKIFTPGHIFYTFSIPQLLTNSLLNTNGIGANKNGIGIVFLITALLGWYGVRNKRVYRYIYGLGIGILLFASSLFPWLFFAHSFLTRIQFTYRYLSYVDLFLAVIASLVLGQFFSGKVFSPTKKIMVVLLLTSGGLISAYSSLIGHGGGPQKPGGNTHPLRQILSAKKPTNLSHKGSIFPPAILDNHNYSRQFSYSFPYTGGTDYFPKKSLSHQASFGIVAGQVGKKPTTQILTHKYYPNSQSYILKTTQPDTVDFPVVKYPGSHLTVNKHPVQLKTSSRGTLRAKIPVGKTRVDLFYRPPIFYKISWWIALICLLSLIFRKLAMNFLKRKKSPIKSNT